MHASRARRSVARQPAVAALHKSQQRQAKLDYDRLVEVRQGSKRAGVSAADERQRNTEAKTAKAERKVIAKERRERKKMAKAVVRNAAEAAAHEASSARAAAAIERERLERKRAAAAAAAAREAGT